jgi:putative restriction endonuclease
VPGPVFGHIPGYPVGSRFESRAELSEAGVHRHRQAGISGSASEGAGSIVLSGGYEDDLDNGDEIVYTGHGGRD